ncbi:hypothetical protein AWB79_00963 [Caballeronia hypogeia]|uniref:Lipoprotein n=1 Tax=Caballeronia hypogeia TaxID=1777140 RepID=A0A157ZIE6_9BURK|nr:hypothetical protein [Caballeronia hypogeia]SAK45256.1 hypothetical protein AWB79_00963 [Caballeronia hypogeia]
MKKILALMCAFAFMAPMLSFAQAVPLTRTESAQPAAQANHDGVSHQPDAYRPQTNLDHMDRDYGASTDSVVQSGWATQPSPQALGQSLFVHH